jgi:hypothetical protein
MPRRGDALDDGEDSEEEVPAKRKKTSSTDPLVQLQALLETDVSELSEAELAIYNTVTSGRAFSDLRRQAINDLIAQELDDVEIKLALLTNPLFITLLNHKSSKKTHVMLQEEIRVVRESRSKEGHAAVLHDYRRLLKRVLAESLNALRTQHGTHFRSLLDAVTTLAQDIATLDGVIQQKAGQIPKPIGSSSGPTTHSPAPTAMAPTPANRTGISDITSDMDKLEERYNPDDDAENDFENEEHAGAELHHRSEPTVRNQNN